MIQFKVWDKKKDYVADIEAIALNESWAGSLCYPDMQGFAITDGDELILLDECGNYAVCPEGRFEVRLI